MYLLFKSTKSWVGKRKFLELKVVMNDKCEENEDKDVKVSSLENKIKQ